MYFLCKELILLEKLIKFIAMVKGEQLLAPQSNGLQKGRECAIGLPYVLIDWESVCSAFQSRFHPLQNLLIFLKGDKKFMGTGKIGTSDCMNTYVSILHNH